MKLLTLLLSLLLVIQSVVAAEDYEIVHWGQVVKVPESKIKEFFGYSYLLSVKKGNQYYGYPIEPSNDSVESKVQKLSGKFVKLEGKIGKRSSRGAEGNQTLDVIYLSQIDGFPVSNLGVAKKKSGEVLNQEMDPVPSQKPVVRQRGKGVSDKVTNAILFGAGAVLMGNLIKSHADK